MDELNNFYHRLANYQSIALSHIPRQSLYCHKKDSSQRHSKREKLYKVFEDLRAVFKAQRK